MSYELLFTVATPLMLRELKITGGQYASIGGIVAAAGTIIGAMWGGYLRKKMELRKAIGCTNLAIRAFVAAISGMALIPFVPVQEE